MAEAAIEALDDERARRVDLVAPAVVLHEDVQGARGQNGGLGARGELRAHGVGPRRDGDVAIEAARKALAVQRPAQDSADHFRAPAGKEARPIHARARNSTSCSAGTSSSRR